MAGGLDGKCGDWGVGMTLPILPPKKLASSIQPSRRPPFYLLTHPSQK